MPKNKSTLILDVGAGSIKAGFHNEKEPRIIDNCIFKAKNVSNKTYIGSELNDCNNLSGMFLFLPFKKGYINNWELEKQILDYTMKEMFDKKNTTLEETNVIFTEPMFNFSSTRETIQEIFFEEYQCNGLILTSAPFLTDFKHRIRRKNEWSLIIDSGYSFTTFIPMHNGIPLYECVKRMTIGGKILTNRLIEVISYGQLDVRSEVYIMNQCKEDTCYVSTQFNKDLNIAKAKNKLDNTIKLQYILPDYVNTRRGYNAPKDKPTTSSDFTAPHEGNADQYSININNERFVIPEILFHPSDVGYNEMGMVEAISYILNELVPENGKVDCYDNIVLSGGSCCFPGFKERLEMDLRACAPDDFPLTIYKDNNPRLSAWKGGYMLANNHEAMNKYLVSKREYNEYGIKYCEEKYPK